MASSLGAKRPGAVLGGLGKKDENEKLDEKQLELSMKQLNLLHIKVRDFSHPLTRFPFTTIKFSIFLIESPR